MKIKKKLSNILSAFIITTLMLVAMPAGPAYAVAAPEIDVQRPASSSIADGGPDALGNQDMGVVRVTYTIANTGGLGLTIPSGGVTAAGLSNASSFTVLTKLPLVVAGSGTKTLQIQFAVDAVGAFSFDLDIDSNDSDEATYDIAVSGTRLAATTHTTCSDAELNSAVSAGGQHIFDCDGIITVGSTKTLTKNLSLEAAPGRSVTIDGDDQYRIFYSTANIYFGVHNLTIANGNIVGDGGAIYLSYTSAWLTVTDSTFSGNSAVNPGAGTAIGGGIYFGSQGALTVTDSTFSGNSAESSGSSGLGGGIAVDDVGTLNITNSTFSGNWADGDTTSDYGGGIYFSDGTNTITNSTFSDNDANEGEGGGIYHDSGSLTVINSTFSGNTAGTGGAIFTSSATLHLKNTILANSTASEDCYLDSSSMGTDTNNLIETNGAGANACGTPVSTADPMLATLANNGGDTKTHALQTGSPAIDTGDATTCSSAPVSGLDQRGVIRPQGTGCDIGAFEHFHYFPWPMFLPAITSNAQK